MESLEQKAACHWTAANIKKITGGKKFPLLPNEAPVLLRLIGILNSDGSMSHDNVRKYCQVNHIINLLIPSLDELASRHKVIRIIDAACGNSYLTLILGWYFLEKKKNPCQIIGIDKNSKLINSCNKKADQLGLSQFVKFYEQELDLNSWKISFSQGFNDHTAPRPNLLLSLHACDTATDFALALGIKEKADVMAIIPCCQAELAAKWSKLCLTNHPFNIIFQTPHFRREIAAQFTDVMRLLLTRANGYEVTATEYIGLEHTLKNRLLLCTRRGKYNSQAQNQYRELKTTLGDCQIKLESLLSSF